MDFSEVSRWDWWWVNVIQVVLLVPFILAGAILARAALETIIEEWKERQRKH